MVEAARPSSRAIPRRLRPSTLSAASRSLSSNLRCVPPDIAPSRIAVLGQSVTTTPQDVALHAGVRRPKPSTRPRSSCCGRGRPRGGLASTRYRAKRAGRGRGHAGERRLGTKGPLVAAFAARRVRRAEGEQLRHGQHAPGDEVWLVGEHRASGERKYHLANLPAETSLKELATLIKARWACEQAHQQLKEELGLDHFEGRSWTGANARDQPGQGAGCRERRKGE